MIVNDLFENVAGPQSCWKGYRKVGTKPGTGKNAGKHVNDCEKIKESTGDFNIGDPVIITGDVEYQGKTGDVREVGRDGAFVVVDLYNYGPYSFHSSDVSYNDYADSEEELNEFALDDSDDPTEDYPCYDCGSTIFLHHTKLCDLAEPNAKRDLPAEPGSQVWTGQVPKGLAPIPGLAEGVAEGSNAKTIKPVTPAAKRYHEKHQWLLNGNVPGAAEEHYAMIQKLNQKGVAEEEKVGNMPADRFDSAMARLKQLAGAGPLKTVWDPQKRVYRNVPTAVQPKK